MPCVSFPHITCELALRVHTCTKPHTQLTVTKCCPLPRPSRREPKLPRSREERSETNQMQISRGAAGQGQLPGAACSQTGLATSLHKQKARRLTCG